ncbi:hypothetical protein [Magnetospirillum sp. ME-1]|uniref:hypothetical protein n=1 Tax=Magnetospirillum sp. ME-1 TaxID=1639348 RepID=UPI0011AE25B5|nr:hypothetical protein [Magnetospirillum sp. ME-1]
MGGNAVLREAVSQLVGEIGEIFNKQAAAALTLEVVIGLGDQVEALDPQSLFADRPSSLIPDDSVVCRLFDSASSWQDGELTIDYDDFRANIDALHSPIQAAIAMVMLTHKLHMAIGDAGREVLDLIRTALDADAYLARTSSILDLMQNFRAAV